MKQYFEEIELLKGFAIIFVLLGHAILVYPVNYIEKYSWCNILHDYIYSFHMPLFFLISGFLCANSLKNKKISRSKFIGNKIHRLLIPYVMISVIDLLPRILLPSMVNKKDNGILFKILIYGGNYWFIYVLFFIFIVFVLMEDMFKRRRYIFLIAIFFVSHSFFSIINTKNYLLLNDLSYYIFFFTFGYFINEKYKIFIDKCVNKKVFFVVITMFLLFGLYKNKNTISMYAVPLLGMYVFYYLSILLTKHVNNFIVKSIKLSGKYSLQLYLLNGFLLVLSRVILISFLKFNNPVIIVVLNFFTTFILGIIITHLFIIKFKITKYIFGA